MILWRENDTPDTQCLRSISSAEHVLPSTWSMDCPKYCNISRLYGVSPLQTLPSTLIIDREGSPSGSCISFFRVQLMPIQNITYAGCGKESSFNQQPGITMPNSRLPSRTTFPSTNPQKSYSSSLRLLVAKLVQAAVSTPVQRTRIHDSCEQPVSMISSSALYAVINKRPHGSVQWSSS